MLSKNGGCRSSFVLLIYVPLATALTVPPSPQQRAAIEVGATGELFLEEAGARDATGLDLPDKPSWWQKFGEDTGRPLYQFNSVELPENRTGRHCIAMRMDKHVHALMVDANEPDNNSIAWGCFNDQIGNAGWSTLEVSTTEDTSIALMVRAYAAGVVEGLLTAERMTQFHSNVRSLLEKDTGGGASLEAVNRVMRMSLAAWEEYAGGDAGEEPKDDMPKQAWAALLQMRGLRDGCNLVAGSSSAIHEFTTLEVMLMNMHLEVPSIVGLYGRSWQARLLDPLGVPGKEEPWPRWASHEAHGSAIVRRLGSKGVPEDLLAGHVTFGDYGEMTRVIKHYSLNFGTLVSKVTMTSYPGCVSSTDDFFITNRGLVAMSASLPVPTSGTYSVPAKSNEGLPAFLRSLMATRLASQPRMWGKIYGHITGIAGAKQWVLVDYNKLKEQQPLTNDTVWLVESLPRVQRSADVSSVVIEDGFFEAHGVAHFAQIREIYGLPKIGLTSYEESKASALVDKAGTISSLADAMNVLTEMSPSRGTSQIPITTRNDLPSSGKPAVPNGGIDAKVVGQCLVRKLGVQAKSGPPITPGGEIFMWNDKQGQETFQGWPHVGLPDSWNFSWASAIPGNFSFPASSDAAECVPEDAM